jgi:4-hydroxy-3-polyprenylbenzoate decarboxylase
MPWRDFRAFLAELERRGDVKQVEGASCELEIGTLTELMAERYGPMLMFDRIDGYPAGHRIASKPYQTASRTALALGLPTDVSQLEMFRVWRERLRSFQGIPPETVTDGPVMENAFEGDEVDLTSLPVPRWHEHDGGPYIGTGCAVVTSDLDTGNINLGTYRCMLHDEKTTGVDIAPYHHGNLHMKGWWAKGKSAPVAVAITPDPYTFLASTQSVPSTLSEYDFAGFVKGAPIEVMKAPRTGLPVPAFAEVVFEGEVPPPDVERREEGPFGEYTGYYAGGQKEAPVIKVTGLYYRSNPIHQGDPPLKPPAGAGHWGGLPLSGSLSRVWDSMERAGIGGVKGVYALPAGGSLVTVISIKQQYAGHASQVGRVASGLLQNMCRMVIVVDEDIDPSNTEEVLWAVATRSDPVDSFEIQRDCPSGTLDPMISPARKRAGDLGSSRVIMVACRPWQWRDEFPVVNRGSVGLRSSVLAKWRQLFA